MPETVELSGMTINLVADKETYDDMTKNPNELYFVGEEDYDAHINIQSNYYPTSTDYTGTFVSGDYNSLLALINDGKLAKILVTLSVYYANTLITTKFITNAVYWGTDYPEIGINTVFRYAYYPVDLDVYIRDDNSVGVIVRPITLVQ